MPFRWLSVLLFLGSSAAATSLKDFDVDFVDCTEYAGIGLVPLANVQALVPSSYTIAAVGSDAIIVVRVAECDSVSVGGHAPSPGTVAHVGITVAGDGSADIDNYTLWYATDNALLHAKLRGAGVNSVQDNHLVFDFVPDGAGSGTLSADVDPPQGPDFTLGGTADVPTAPGVPFVARWWRNGQHGAVSMTTTFPAIQFGGASVTLNTSAGSALAHVIGATTLQFSFLDSHNAFFDAFMEVRL